MRYSVIIPHCHGAPESSVQRQELDAVLRRLDRYELLAKFSGCPTIEHAIIAGLRAARGEAVVIIEPGERYPATQLPVFLRGLARADFVCGRRRRRGWPKLVERASRLPRWLFLGLDARDPDCLLWAARREVFNGLPLAPRFVRYLPSLVARQGFRVDSVYVEERKAPQPAGAATSATINVPHVAPANLFAAWWACYKLRGAERAAPSGGSQSAEGHATATVGRAVTSSSSERHRAKSA
ncbi:MAG: hypothetical protein WD894_10895 [Pirellulales bacterium]